MTQPPGAPAPGSPVAITLKEPAGREPRTQTHSEPRVATTDNDSYVRNSSFLSRDLEAKKQTSPPKTPSPPKVATAPKVAKENSKDDNSPPKVARGDSKDDNSVAARANRIEAACSPPKKDITSPPLKKETSPPKAAKVTRTNSKDGPPKVPKRENSLIKDKDKDKPAKTEKVPEILSEKLPPAPSKEELASIDNAAKIASANTVTSSAKTVTSNAKTVTSNVKTITSNVKSVISANVTAPSANIPAPSANITAPSANMATLSTIAPTDNNTKAEPTVEKSPNNEESKGVGDKIKKFEKAAEDASGGRLSRPGSIRRIDRGRIGSDSKDDFPPPATPFKDNVHFELAPEKQPEKEPEPKHGIIKNPGTPRWQRSESHEKHEPQKIIKPEFKPMPSPADVTIRSPSLGAKPPEQFPSHGTAFRNVASPDRARTISFEDEVTTHPNLKPCKLKNPEKKYSISKGSSYFTRGSEEIWLVKKKDIEEIEERVLDSFRRAGGNVCMRSESVRPASEGGHAHAFTHATMGRTKRHGYARSESLDPQWAGARAHTLKRQTSVACTCGHDKKPTRGANASGSEATPHNTPRPRSRSHTDESSAHVLDKYETLV